MTCSLFGCSVDGGRQKILVCKGTLETINPKTSQLLDSMHPINWHHVAHAGPMTIEQRHNKTCPNWTPDRNVGTAGNHRMKLLQPLQAMLKPRNDCMIYIYALFDIYIIWWLKTVEVSATAATHSSVFPSKHKHKHMTRNHEARIYTDTRNSQHYRQHQGWTE